MIGRESVTGKAVQNTSSLKETNQNISGLSSLVKEQNCGSTFRSKFGFKPGIFNNKNASRGSQKVTKVIESVDNLSLNAGRVSSLVKRSDFASQPQQAESEYISSGDSATSTSVSSSISSDTESRPPARREAGANLNTRVLDCNSNTPPAKPQRTALLLSSPRLRRVVPSPQGSPRSPRSQRSPRPKPRLLPKPSSGPSPYRTQATVQTRPLVTAASGDAHKSCVLAQCVASTFHHLSNLLPQRLQDFDTKSLPKVSCLSSTL